MATSVMDYKSFCFLLPFVRPSNAKRGKERRVETVEPRQRCSWHIEGHFGGYEFLYSLRDQYPDIWEVWRLVVSLFLVTDW